MCRSLTRHALFGDLSVVDLFLQGEITDEAVNVARFPLTVAVHPAHRLGIVTRVPGGIKDNDTVCTDQIYSQAARSERKKEQINDKMSARVQRKCGNDEKWRAETHTL